MRKGPPPCTGTVPSFVLVVPAASAGSLRLSVEYQYSQLASSSPALKRQTSKSSPALTLSGLLSSSTEIMTSSPLPPTRKSKPDEVPPPATVSLPPSPTTVSLSGPP